MKMGGVKDGPNVMDRCKKQKAIMPMWRPISTQSVDCSGRSDVQYEVQEVCNNASSCMDDVQNVTQDEPNSGIPTSLTESTNVVNSDRQSEFIERKRSVLLSSEIEDAPGRRACETDSKSNEAIYQKEGTEETLQEVSSNNDAESGCGVEKHLISVETCMKGSPAKACVVYAPVVEIDGEECLLRACQIIIDAYVEAGRVLEKDAHQTLKLSEEADLVRASLSRKTVS